MSCWLWADISTIFLQHHDTSSSAPCQRDWYPRTSISTQHISIRKVHGVPKKCVRNRARPEGSITSAYGTEEVIDFCVDFIDDLKSIGVPESRYEGRLTGKGTLERNLMSAQMISHSRKRIMRFFNNHPWLTRISRNTRKFCSPNSRKSLRHGLHVSTWTLSAAGCGSI